MTLREDKVDDTSLAVILRLPPSITVNALQLNKMQQKAEGSKACDVFGQPVLNSRLRKRRASE